MLIGITGNSGVGKSHLIKNINRQYYLIDADKIGHKSLLMPDCKAEIVEVFGSDILNDNEINRKKLGSIVFLDKTLLDKLTQITSKYILNEIEKQIVENNTKYELLILDAPLLVEYGLHKKCDKTILIVANYEEKIKRIMERDGVTEEVAIGRLNKQKDDVEQQKNVDITFENSYNLKSIENFNNLINDIME